MKFIFICPPPCGGEPEIRMKKLVRNRKGRYVLSDLRSAVPLEQLSPTWREKCTQYLELLQGSRN